MFFYQYTKQQLAAEFKTDPTTGLSVKEALERLKKFGPNVLPEKPPESWVVIFLRQFQSPLIYILVICAAIIFYLKEITDAAIILTVLLVNALIGAIQEGRAGHMLRSLKKLSGAEATVLREGQEVVVLETEVTTGDILVLKEGQRVAADARLIFSRNLSLDESMLTGESAPVHKKDGSIAENNLPVSAQHNMVFKGTAVLGGDGQAIITAIGAGTEVGKISQSLMMPEAEMPLQKNIKQLSKYIIYLVLLMSVGLFVLGLWSGHSAKEMFSLIVSLGVSVIPEGLPLILTLILAHGVWRMSKKNALVKKMQAVEALGQADVIAVDKTGTLTKNEMVIKQIYTGKKIYHVTGNGYQPRGQVFYGDRPVENLSEIKFTGLVAALAGKASVSFLQDTGIYKVSGDPTEAAMLVLGEKLGINREAELKTYREVSEIPFEYKNKYRAVFYEFGEKIFCAAVGAPEVILKHSARFAESGIAHEKTGQDQKLFEEAVEEFAQKGFRVVAFAYKQISKNHPTDNINDLVFGGLFAIEDALRPEALRSVKFAEEAGVKIVMITGDLKNTAKAIAREAGIYKEGDVILTGTELADMSESQLTQKLPQVSVFARVTPEDKMNIIRAYKALGRTVAMTGDGVNDAPSLVAADLGVAMGKIGTEVAKEAADIVLLDDNLSSIITAIKEGRVMYANIKKALQFLFSTSLGEMLTVVLSLVLRMPVPVSAVQILWLNLITDPLSGAALALEKEEEGISRLQKKKNLAKFFIDGQMLTHILSIGLAMAFGTLYLYNSYYQIDPVKAGTMALTLLAVFQWYNSINCRFSYLSIFNRRVFGNIYIWLSFILNVIFQYFAVSLPWFNNILRTKPLEAGEWAVVFVMGFIVIFVEEIRKLIYRFLHKI